MQGIDTVFEWYEVTALLIGLGGLVLGKRRIDLTKLEQANKIAKQSITEKKQIENRLNEIELRLHHLDNPQTGRVHKLSNLVEQINNDSKKLWAVSYSARTLASRQQFKR